MVRGNVKIEQIGDMKFQILESDLVFANDEVMIEVHSGWYTDGGSVPRLLWNILPPFGTKEFKAYILHDSLWEMRCKFKGMYSMEFTNAVLEQANKECGVSWWRRKLIQLGVSKWTYFAWKKWNNPSKEVRDWHKDIITIKWSKQ